MNSKKYILIILGVSFSSLFFAPLLMPDSYYWVIHTTSESGAQGVDGAWLARTGFVLYGIAVLMLSFVLRKQWPLSAVIFHLLFGFGMVGNAVFSSMPWDKTLPFDVFEDTLHSWMSGLVGMAFTVGVLILYFKRERENTRHKIYDLFAIFVSVAVSVAMMNQSGFDGLIQRFMFLVSYLWYGHESLSVNRRYTDVS